MSEHSPLIIARFMDVEQQKTLAQDVVRQVGVSLEELPLELLASGQAYLPLITEEQYAGALASPRGQLKHLPESESQEILEMQIQQHRTAPHALTAKIDKTANRARAGLSVISYRFTLPDADDEYERFTHVLDDLNDTRTEWKPLYAKLILAVMLRSDKRAGPLARAFKAVRPADVLLTEAKVIQPGELNQPVVERVAA